MKYTSLLGVAIPAVLLSACGSTDPVSATATLPTPVLAALDTAIQDEFHAEATYVRVLADFGSVLPFFKVVVAERRHSASLADLYARRGLTPPPSAWSTGNVPGFPALSQACSAAVEAEVANIGVYDRFLGLQLPADVRTVFISNRRASLENHLPAFERCR